LGPRGAERAPDPALAPWANFTVAVQSDFNGGPSEGWNGYDRQTHKFDPEYVNPQNYQLRFDARLGMDLNRPHAVTMSVNLGGGRTSIDDFLDLVDAPPDFGGGGGVGGGGEPIVPANVVAFRWTVSRTDGSFSNSKLVMRPITLMEQAVFEVPSRGTYDVTLRVIFADGSSGERSVQVKLREWFIVSMGDSAASGQGNPDLPATLGISGGTVCRNTTLSRLFGVTPHTSNDATWIERKAYRSMKSGPALAALSVQKIGGATRTSEGKQVDQIVLDKVVFASFARSGAEVFVGLIGSQGGGKDFIGAGQIEECRRTAAGRRIDALMLSIGGNDAGFSGVLRDLVAKDSVIRAQMPPLGTGDDDAERRRINERLDQILGVGLPPGQKGDLENAYDALHDQITRLRRELGGIRHVYWAGYPTSLFEIRNESGRLGFRSCGVFSGPDLDIDRRDADVIRKRGRTLNALIARKVQEFDAEDTETGWHFVDVEPDFQGHGYCESADETYFVGMEESCRTQGDFEGTMHPNFRGHAVYGLHLSRAIRRNTFPRPVPATGGPQSPPPESPVTG
jgi:hypothetical protein